MLRYSKLFIVLAASLFSLFTLSAQATTELLTNCSKKVKHRSMYTCVKSVEEKTTMVVYNTGKHRFKLCKSHVSCNTWPYYNGGSHSIQPGEAMEYELRAGESMKIARVDGNISKRTLTATIFKVS